MHVFVAGLPRSGSTLLCNLLAQNPAISVPHGTSPLTQYVASVRSAALQSPEFKADVSEEVKDRLGFAIQGLIEGHMRPASSECVAMLDKSRGWLTLWALAQRVLPDAKMLITIRDPRGVLSSLERRNRREVIELDPVHLEEESGALTVGERVRAWMKGGLVGKPLRQIGNLIQTREILSTQVVRMEDLLTHPYEVMREVYRYLELPEFSHDFNNIVQHTYEMDAVYGMSGLHEVHDTLEPIKEDWDSVLGKGISETVRQRQQWFYNFFYPGRVD